MNSPPASTVPKRSHVSQPNTRSSPSAVASPLNLQSRGLLHFDRFNLIAIAVLLAAIFASYYPVTHNDYVNYDDYAYIVENAHVKEGLTWDTIVWAFTSYDAANWHPLTWLSHALDYQIFGANPVATHWENVVLHAINAILLFLLLLSATDLAYGHDEPSPKRGEKSGLRWRSLMVAALFALHPINVESVAWAAERKNVLSTLFFLLALRAYIEYVKSPSPRRYAGVAVLFVLALLAKPQVITFPFLLLLIDYWPLRRMSAFEPSPTSLSGPTKLSFQNLLLEKISLLLLAAASAVLTVLAQDAGGAVRDLSHYTLLLRVETTFIAYVLYIGKALWPSRLAGLYPHPLHLYPAWEVLAAATALLLITFLALRTSQRRYLAMGWFWFLGSLVPVIGLVQVGDQELADRYAYTSFIGLFLMIVWSVADWAAERRVSSRWLAAASLLWLLPLGLLTHRQTHYWQNTQAFWTRDAAVTRNNYVAHTALAGILHGEGKNQEAIAEVQAVLAIRPEDAAANLLLGDIARNRGDFKQAIERYGSVAHGGAGTGVRAHGYDNMGFTYRMAGQIDQAKQAFIAGIALLPEQPTILVQLGVLAHLQADWPSAIRYYAQAMKLQTTDVGLVLLADALQQAGRTDESQAILKRATAISPNLEAAQDQAQALLDGN